MLDNEIINHLKKAVYDIKIEVKKSSSKYGWKEIYLTELRNQLNNHG